MSSIFIFRRDFRVNDNTGLLKAFKESILVYPIFIFNPKQIDDKNNSFKSHNSVQFMIESLDELRESIPLEYYYGNDIDVLSDFIKTVKIKAIYFHFLTKFS